MRAVGTVAARRREGDVALAGMRERGLIPTVDVPGVAALTQAHAQATAALASLSQRQAAHSQRLASIATAGMAALGDGDGSGSLFDFSGVGPPPLFGPEDAGPMVHASFVALSELLSRTSRTVGSRLQPVLADAASALADAAAEAGPAATTAEQRLRLTVRAAAALCMALNPCCSNFGFQWMDG